MVTLGDEVMANFEHETNCYKINARYLRRVDFEWGDEVRLEFSVPLVDVSDEILGRAFGASPCATIAAATADGQVARRLVASGTFQVRPLGLPEKVIFNGPATICIWRGGSKAVAKLQPGDRYNSRAGIMACLLKHAYGSRYLDFLRDHECRDVDESSIENFIDHMLDVMLGIDEG